MRLETGIRPGAGPDALNDVEIAALKSAKGSVEDAKKVLLEMADMIRTLKLCWIKRRKCRAASERQRSRDFSISCWNSFPRK